MERDLRTELIGKMEVYQKNKQVMFDSDGNLLPKFQNLACKFKELKSSVYSILKEYVADRFTYMLIRNDERGKVACNNILAIISSKSNELREAVDKGTIDNVDSVIESINNEICPIYIAYTAEAA